MFIEEWRSKGIWAVAHFMDDNGNLLQHEFCEKFQLQCTVKVYNRIVKATSISLISLVKENILYCPDSSQLCIECADFCDNKCTNRFIRTIFIKEAVPWPNQEKICSDGFWC